MNKSISPTQKRVRFMILTIGIITALGFLLIDPIIRPMMKRDRKSGEKQTGVATVEMLVPMRFDEYGRKLDPQVTVRFRGSLIPSDGVFNSDKLKPGDQAEISYRVGKSGRVYIESVQPLAQSH